MNRAWLQHACTSQKFRGYSELAELLVDVADDGVPAAPIYESGLRPPSGSEADPPFFVLGEQRLARIRASRHLIGPLADRDYVCSAILAQADSSVPRGLAMFGECWLRVVVWVISSSVLVRSFGLERLFCSELSLPWSSVWARMIDAGWLGINSESPCRHGQSRTFREVADK